jgi:hypothetical protein
VARIRTIKPEFFTSEDIVSLPPLTRLLYIALWCEADKEGRLAWGSDGLSATSFQMPAYARKECAAIIYRDASGTLFTEWRG